MQKQNENKPAKITSEAASEKASTSNDANTKTTTAKQKAMTFRQLFWRVTDKKLLFTSITFSVINALSAIGLLQVFRNIINGTQGESLGVQTYLGVLLLALLISQAVTGMLVTRMGNETLTKMRKDLVKQVIASPYTLIEKLGAEKIYAVLSVDINAIKIAILAVPSAIIGFSVSMLAIAYIGYISLPHLGIILVAAAITIFVSENFLSENIKRHARTEREMTDTMYQGLRDVVFGNKEIKLSHQRDTHLKQRILDEELPKLQTVNNTKEDQVVFYNSWSIFSSFFIISLFLMCHLLWLPLPSGELVGITIALIYLRGPLIALVNAIPTFIGANISLRHVQNLQLTLHETAAESAQLQTQEQWSQLSLNNVSYRHEGNDEFAFALKPTSLTINQGELIYIIGGNGSGKSTFMKLLCGLYPSQSGQITFGETPIESNQLDWYRNQFSSVFGDFYLFDTVLDDQSKPISKEVMQRWLTYFKLDKRVGYDNDKLSTTALSAGQRKRLALLSTLAEDKPVLLLDEWAADQDPQYREFFYHEILPMLKSQGKTIIAITHDEHYFHTADRVLKMDFGELTEIPVNQLQADKKLTHKEPTT